MPKRHRDYQKRSLGYVLGCLDRVMEHALTVKAEFDAVVSLDPLADDYTDRLIALAPDNPHARYTLLLHTGLLQSLQTQRTFEDFATLSWGYVPDRIERWTGTGQEYNAKQQP